MQYPHYQKQTQSLAGNRHFARINLYVHVHAIALKTERAVGKVGLPVHCLPKGLGTEHRGLRLSPRHYKRSERFLNLNLSICWYYCTIRGASCWKTCNIVLYISCLSIALIISFISLLSCKVQTWMGNYMSWKPPVDWSSCDLGWASAELSVSHSCLSRFLWTVVHFSLVCFALELSILE